MGHALPDLQFDQSLRHLLLRGFSLSSDLHHRLLHTPPGEFGLPPSSHLRSSFALSALEIVSTFNDSIKLLLSFQSEPPPCIASPSLKRAFPAVRRSCSVDTCRKLGCGTAESLLSTSRNADTPPLSPSGLPAAVMKNFSPSPPRSSNSPPSETSEGSPTRILMAEHDKNATGRTSETIETAETDATARENTRRRKLLPKISLKMPASNLDQGVETPPDDGHTWRKYGQKDILGARYPRSYYRCTHKTDLGCQAIKQVQRCEEDHCMFDVTYRGHHTCRSAQLEQMWPFALPHPVPHLVMQCLPGSQASIPPIFTPDIVVSPTDLQFSSPPRVNSQQHNLPYPNSSISSTSLTLRPPRETPFRIGLGQTKPDGYSDPVSNAGLPDHIAGDYFNFNPRDLSSLRSIRQKLSEDETKGITADGNLELHSNLLSPEPKESISSVQHQLIFSASQDWLKGREVTIATTQIESSAQGSSCGLRCAGSLREEMQKAESTAKEASEEVPASSAFMELLEDSPLNWTFEMDCDTMADRL